MSRAERFEALFHAALELEGEERERFLASSCADDSDLRREVEALLAFDAVADERVDRAAPAALGLGESSSSLLVGRWLGPYFLRRCLAAGGMGAVYEATQQSPRRTVAVKVLRGDLGSEELERRFGVESSFLARLQHPAIAHVYEAGVAELDGLRVPFIAMELVEDARNITHFARERALDVGARLKLFAEVCDAVHHGHQRGVIHRDLKPGNVLIDGSGRVKLIDFGVARAVDPDGVTQRTEAGVLLGTVQYMSPEQCVDARDLDVRSDVYSLGVVLYELLCGRLPYDFEGATLPLAARIVQERLPRRPSTLMHSARGDLETILMKALDKDRARRYQSAAELGEDLRRYLRREPIAARAPSWPYRFALFARRHKALVSSLITVFLVVLGAAIVSARFAFRANRAREREELSTALANVAAADLSLRTYDSAAARQRLERVPSDLREWEWSHLASRLDLALQVLDGPSARCESLAWRGGRIASAWYYPSEGKIALWDGASGAKLAESERLAEAPTAISIAGDGTIVWGEFNGSLRRWDPAAGTTFTLDSRHGARVTGIYATEELIVSASLDGTIRLSDLGHGGAWAVLGDGSVPWCDLALAPGGADGHRAAVGGADGTVRVFALETGEEQLALAGHAGEVSAVAFRPDGAAIASGSTDGTVRVWDLESARELRRLIGHESEVQDVAFLPGGELLLSVSTDRTLRVWDVEAGFARVVLMGHANTVRCVAPAEDGARVATGSYDGTLRIWDPLVDAGSRRIAGHAGFVRSLAFAPDGRLLATASLDRTSKLYETGKWTELATLAGHADRVSCVAFHPTRRLLATASIDCVVRLWNADTGELLRALEGHDDGVLAVAFSPDGTLLATGAKDGRVLLRETEGFQLVATLQHAADVQRIAFDPTGAFLATVTHPSGVGVWSIRRQDELWRMEPAELPHDVAYSPDGTLLATAMGNFDGTGLAVRLWDAKTGAERGTLAGHTDIVLSVAFAPDGQRLASGSADGTIRLWDPVSAEEVLVLRGHEGWVWSVAFSPNGALLASGGGNEDGTGVGVRVWEARDRLTVDPGSRRGPAR